MPIPSQKPKETEKKFISRCIKTLAKKEGSRYTNKQRQAICFDAWRNK